METRPTQVIIFGTDRTGRPFSEPASLYRASTSDAVVGDLFVSLKANDVVGLRYGSQKARFRVAWMGEKGTARAGQAGLRALDIDIGFWSPYGPSAEPSQLEVSQAPPAPAGMRAESGGGRDRRRHERVTCNGGVKFQHEGSETPVWATLQDLSEGGCYLETVSTAQKFSRLRLAINLDDLHLEAVGVVEACHPAYGMGVKFVHMTPPSQRTLEEWVRRHGD